MGAVAIGFFIAAAFALAIACCGREPIPKLIGAYLFCTWMVSNQIFMRHTPLETMATFSYFDVAAIAVLTPVMLWRPSWWLFVILASLYAQVGFQSYYRAQDPDGRDNTIAWRIENALYAVQLLAVALPVLLSRRRRQRKPYVRRSRVNLSPPYDGWEPPPDYRMAGNN